MTYYDDAIGLPLLMVSTNRATWSGLVCVCNW